MATIEDIVFDIIEEEGFYSRDEVIMMLKSMAEEQKAIDDAEIVRLKAAWEKEAEINHDAEMAYKQGRHDAICKACEIYEKELRQMKRILNEVKDGAGNLISVGGSLCHFRKDMEE